MFEILKQSKVKRLLILAILLRLLIMPFYFHPDIKTYNFQASFLKEGVWNIYDYLKTHKNELPLKDEFVYFPLTYYFLGSYQFLVSPILGEGFEKWLYNAQSNSSLDIGVFRYLFILKFPYLILDILIGFLLTTFFLDLKSKKRAFTFWLFNPFSIVLIYIYSNVDIFPVFLIVLSAYFFNKNHPLLSGLMLGIGGGFKAFPVLLAPFLLAKVSGFRNKLLVLLFSLGAFVLTILPFLKSQAFKESTLVSGLTTRIVSGGLDIGFGEILMPAIVLLSILFFWGLSKVKVELWRFYLVALLLVLISIHFHIHWLLWLIPFLTLVYSWESKEETKLVVGFLLIAFAIPLLYTDKFMTVGLFKAISPLYELLPIPSIIMNRIYDPSTIQGILHSMLFGLGLFLSLRIIKKE